MLKIYGIKNCDSVKKAIKYLKTHEISYAFVDFRETPVNTREVESWLNYTNIETLLNTRGTTYKTLGLKKLNLSDADKILWLSKENMLIKRPVIVSENVILVGYNETLYQEKLH